MKNFTPVSLEGTVVGLLFSKTGKEIQEVIKNKVGGLKEEAGKYTTTISKVDEFLKEKEKEIDELDELYEERKDEKETQARPFRRQIDEVHKLWGDKEFEINRETERLVGERAVEFEKGFDEFEESFDEIDDLALEITEDNKSIRKLTIRRSGNVGVGASVNSLSLEDGNTGFYQTADNINFSAPLPTNEDRALARINTLRKKVTSYKRLLTVIKDKVNIIESEAKRLNLISKHLTAKKDYTLDLEGLAALGFDV